MAWNVRFAESAAKQLAALDRPVQERILRFLRERIIASDSPRQTGKALRGDMAGIWRYRVGDYRILCRLHEQELLVLVLAVGHRRNVYNK